MSSKSNFPPNSQSSNNWPEPTRGTGRGQGRGRRLEQGVGRGQFPTSITNTLNTEHPVPKDMKKRNVSYAPPTRGQQPHRGQQSSYSKPSRSMSSSSTRTLSPPVEVAVKPQSTQPEAQTVEVKTPEKLFLEQNPTSEEIKTILLRASHGYRDFDSVEAKNEIDDYFNQDMNVLKAFFGQKTLQELADIYFEHSSMTQFKKVAIELLESNSLSEIQKFEINLIFFNKKQPTSIINAELNRIYGLEQSIEWDMKNNKKG